MVYAYPTSGEEDEIRKGEKLMKGLSAYKVINKMAQEVYGDQIHVEAAIFGDDYIVRDSKYQLLVAGNTESVFNRLLKMKAEKAVA